MAKRPLALAKRSEGKPSKRIVLREPANPDSVALRARFAEFERQRDGQVRSPFCCNCSLHDNSATAYHPPEPQTGLFASTYLFIR
ncbi:hypothetical protein [Microcoleus sp. BROC3]|uniref:hypothetical protein n=1 Tax=Microcoleus sp. BROC3 TaxID=3055323 RepID=UPI002FCE944A